MKTTKFLTAITLAALWGTGAEAAQITFGPSNQSITFTGNGASSVSVSSPILTGMAFDTTNAAVGSFTITALSLTAGPQAGNLFPASANTETFTYTNPDNWDSVTESWHITTIQDNTPQPKFFGIGTTTAISGDATFLAAFGPVGATDTFDWIENSLSCAHPADCTTLDRLATTEASAGATLSSGEDLTSPNAVPEPGSLALLAAALGALGMARRQGRGAAAVTGSTIAAIRCRLAGR